MSFRLSFNVIILQSTVKNPVFKTNCHFYCLLLFFFLSHNFISFCFFHFTYIHTHSFRWHWNWSSIFWKNMHSIRNLNRSFFPPFFSSSSSFESRTEWPVCSVCIVCICSVGRDNDDSFEWFITFLYWIIWFCSICVFFVFDICVSTNNKHFQHPHSLL